MWVCTCVHIDIFIYVYAHTYVRMITDTCRTHRNSAATSSPAPFAIVEIERLFIKAHPFAERKPVREKTR